MSLSELMSNWIELDIKYQTFQEEISRIRKCAEDTIRDQKSVEKQIQDALGIDRGGSSNVREFIMYKNKLFQITPSGIYLMKVREIE